MQVMVEESDGVAVVALSGRADSVAASSLARWVAEAAAIAGGRVAIDLGEVTYIRSAGLSVLLAASKAASEAGGLLVLCRLSEGVREVASLAGVLPVFSVTDPRAAAVIQARRGCTPALGNR